jgi:hypothetical protein
LHKFRWAERTHPSAAEALRFIAISGTAEAVPFQNTLYATASKKAARLIALETSRLESL